MAKNYETDRNESNYAGKNHGESASRNCGKNSSKNNSGNSSRNSSKSSYGNFVSVAAFGTVPNAATETKFPMNMILRRTEALTDIKG